MQISLRQTREMSCCHFLWFFAQSNTTIYTQKHYNQPRGNSVAENKGKQMKETLLFLIYSS